TAHHSYYYILNLHDALPIFILINDESQDETETILRRYLGNTKLPLKYTKQTHHNYFKAIRHGLKYASGEIIFVLDADKILFNQNVFYRAVSTILGEKCEIERAHV